MMLEIRVLFPSATLCGVVVYRVIVCVIRHFYSPVALMVERIKIVLKVTTVSLKHSHVVFIDCIIIAYF